MPASEQGSQLLLCIQLKMLMIKTPKKAVTTPVYVKFHGNLYGAIKAQLGRKVKGKNGCYWR